jgi:hypothetical protein
MNAIIALCHFCDYHGPRTLFCTQAFKYSEFQQQQQLQNQQKSSNLSNTSTRTNRTYNNKTDTNNLTTNDRVEFVLEPAPPESLSPNLSTANRFNIEQQNITNFSSSPSSNSTHSLSPKIGAGLANNSGSNLEAVNSTCKACRAFDKSFHYYISYDDSTTLNGQSATRTSNTSESSGSSQNNANICYLSQSTPSDSEVFALVRKACLRTLHCEVFEDPIYFDDDKNGSVIGYEFNIKDSEGRGFQRSYSLIIIMKDRIYLQHLWSFLSKQMAIIASNIKLEAERKFNKDMSEKEMLNPISSLLINTSQNSNNNNNSGNEQTSGGLSNASNTSSEQRILTPSSSFYGPSTSSASAYQRQAMYTKKKTSKQVRGLIELTDDSMIFAKLHMWFTWILRMSSCQITEEFVHGILYLTFLTYFYFILIDALYITSLKFFLKSYI